MEPLEKLRLLGCQMNLEPAEETGLTGGAERAPALAAKGDLLPIHKAAMPGGKHITLLKSLLTSACERDCFYCPFRAGRDFHRASFQPTEMAQLFMQMHQAGYVEGMFLSSGVAGGGVRTQDQLIDTAEILRRKLSYQGYLHLKLMPGAQREQVLRAMQLADRVSLNLEAPTTRHLRQLAPHKIFMDELLQPLKWVEEWRRNLAPDKTWKGHWPSLTTQFVVGGADESDVDLLGLVQQLTQQLHLKRAYFSAFNPIPDTPLDGRPPENPWREHRLYQASFLLRDYGFGMEELPFAADGRLPLATDPKLGWAQAHLQHAPVEVNRADRHELLRVPGIGLQGAEAILRARRRGRLRELQDLRALGVLAKRAAPFVLLDGRRPAFQLRLL